MRNRIICLLIFTLLTIHVKSNMAYMGPLPSQVSGQNIIGKLRISHELLTVDMRNIMAQKVVVFANYRIHCMENLGKIQFLFVATANNPVIPEIILDGKIIKIIPNTQMLAYSFGEESHKQDSLKQLIGWELNSFKYHNQSILNQLFSFDLEMTAGFHVLKIGYNCEPTGYEMNDLRYTAFPYFLGNKYTKMMYDSIFVKVILPGDVQHESNFNLTEINSEWVSGNIAGFKESHIYISVFKDIKKELDLGWNIFWICNILFWILLVIITIIYIRKRMNIKGKIGMGILWVIPLAFAVAFGMYFSMMYYYHFFENKYGNFLVGAWGKGYYFIMIPFMMFFAAVAWLLMVFIYNKWIYKRKTIRNH